jgi:hypothetical protein
MLKCGQPGNTRRGVTQVVGLGFLTAKARVRAE